MLRLWLSRDSRLTWTWSWVQSWALREMTIVWGQGEMLHHLCPVIEGHNLPGGISFFKLRTATCYDCFIQTRQKSKWEVFHKEHSFRSNRFMSWLFALFLILLRISIKLSLKTKLVWRWMLRINSRLGFPLSKISTLWTARQHSLWTSCPGSL